MNGSGLSKPESPTNTTLITCLLIAMFVEVGAILLSGVHFHLPAHKTEVVETPTDVEVLTMPEEAPHLKSEAPAPPAKSNEETVSEKPKEGSATKSLSDQPSNQVQKGKPISPTHGPVLVDSPQPVIPDYLKDRDLNAKVLIEFNVLASGQTEPKLLVSSGDQELDQIALAAAKKWTFYPAEKDHQAVDAKVRLRILFSVK